MARITQMDIAREAGVSQAAVSLVLSGRDVTITLDVRERVLAAAARLGYRQRFRPIPAERATGIFGYLIPDTDQRAYFDDAIERVLHRGALQATEAGGRHLLVASYAWDGTLPEIVARGMVDGLIVDTGAVDRRLDPAFFARLDAVIPYVMLDCVPETFTAWAAAPDDHGGIGKAIRHLAELGHTRIGYFGPPPTDFHPRARLRGWHAALAHGGLAIRETDVQLFPSVERSIDETEQFARQALAAWRAQDAPVTAAITYNDVYAATLVRMAQHAGLAVPADLSVAGYDDSTHYTQFHPALTTIRQPMEEIGRLAVHLLEERLAHPDRPARQVLVDVTLVARASTGRAPAV